MTNGDVFKKNFPDVIIDEFVHDVNIRTKDNVVVGNFRKEWWKAEVVNGERD